MASDWQLLRVATNYVQSGLQPATGRILHWSIGPVKKQAIPSDPVESRRFDPGCAIRTHVRNRGVVCNSEQMFGGT